MFFNKDRITFMDGGMGSLLQKRGLTNGEIPEVWNITHSEDIIQIHSEYIHAGSEYILANTFGANPVKYTGEEYSLEEVISSAVTNVRTAAERTNNGSRIYAGLDIGPTGKLLEPMGNLSFDECYACYAEAVSCGVKAGVDFIHIETMTDLYELKAAVLAAKENSDLPVSATVAYGKDGKLLTGADVSVVAAVLEGLRVDAIGMNCGLGPIQVLPLVRELKSYTDLPIIVKPNAGLPEIVDGKTVYNMDAEAFALAMTDIVAAGGVILGGCCGTTPEYIAALVDKCRGMSPVNIPARVRTVCTSYCRTVEFGERPVIIGERINPSGKDQMKSALQADDMDYVVREAVAEDTEGADVLDINVGLPDIDEPAMMRRVIREVQNVTGRPLTTDTTNISAMEQAMRYYNGKILINSVSGRQDSMDAVLPLMAKYGGVAMILTLDERGIPATARERADIVGKVLKEAAGYGIPANDFIVDTLTMSVSAKPDGAIVALEAIRLIRQEYGIYTSLGVSNISFGLPNRSVVTSVFYAQALEAGLNAAIMNPASEEMMKVYHVHNMLKGYDENCSEYIKFASELQVQELHKAIELMETTEQNMDAAYNEDDQYDEKAAKIPLKIDLADALFDAVIKGLKSDAASVALDLLEKMEPLDIINKCIVPALNVIGDGFEDGSIFLPGLITGAEAAQSACAVIKERMVQNGSAREPKGKIVLCTVKDDIHDIGKNIVKILLENYGYDVVDLGKNVAPEAVVEAVRETGAPLVGLSALMTTTACNMEETIRQIRDAGLDCKIAVGGAVITEEYAGKIGADYFCEDAMQTVRAAKEVMGR